MQCWGLLFVQDEDSNEPERSNHRGDRNQCRLCGWWVAGYRIDLRIMINFLVQKMLTNIAIIMARRNNCIFVGLHLTVMYELIILWIRVVGILSKSWNDVLCTNCIVMLVMLGIQMEILPLLCNPFRN